MAKKYTLLFSLLTLFIIPSEAQTGLEGLWEGTLSTGGIHSRTGYKFELYLKKVGRKWQGRSLIYLDDGTTLEMNVHGRFYEDRSLYFRDIEFIPIEGSDFLPEFYRKYELIYERSIYESKLDGYWQEIGKSFEKRRKQGRIFLRKVKAPSKA